MVDVILLCSVFLNIGRKVAFNGIYHETGKNREDTQESFKTAYSVTWVGKGQQEGAIITPHFFQ